MNSSNREQEFFANVWNHADDEFQASFDERRMLNATEQNLLISVANAFRDGHSDESVANTIKQLLDQSDPRLMELLLQISGLTRSKILQDLKAKAERNSQPLRLSNHLGLVRHDDTWRVAGPYLAAKLRRVLHPPQMDDQPQLAFESLNQATWPGYIRQERAKRSGHEAEYRIATLLSNCGIPFQPAEKADNPLCRDAQFKGVSFDIVIPNAERPLVCVKSTVHTANIGQYGESKDALEIDEARRMIDGLPPHQRPDLVGFIDGVGFKSNIAGLKGVLQKSDEFVQFRTMWKLVVVACARLGWHCTLAIPRPTAMLHADFLAKYRASIDMIEPHPAFEGHLAGEVKVLVAH